MIFSPMGTPAVGVRSLNCNEQKEDDFCYELKVTGRPGMLVKLKGTCWQKSQAKSTEGTVL